MDMELLRLRRAIVMESGDDVVRMAYGDLLEERGYDEEALFVRVGLEISKIQPQYCEKRWRIDSGGTISCGECNFCRLERTIGELINKGKTTYDSDIAHGMCLDMSLDAGTYLSQVKENQDQAGPIIRFERGFATEMYHVPVDLLPTLSYEFATNPLKKVVITHTYPFVTNNRWWFISSYHPDLYIGELGRFVLWGIARYLGGQKRVHEGVYMEYLYDSREEAFGDLYRATMCYVKELGNHWWENNP